MKKLLLTVCVACLGFISADLKAQSGTYRDDQGEYRYETREERVWVPERRTGGIFGVGGRTIPGHYETQTRQVKVYRDQNGNPVRDRNYEGKSKGWEGKHPHGMPPGQRKKANRNDDRYDERRDRNNDGVFDERDRRYDRNGDGVIDERDRRYDRNGDGVINERDRRYDRNGDGVIDDRDRTYRRDSDDDDDDDDDKSNKNKKHSKNHKKGKSKK